MKLYFRLLLLISFINPAFSQIDTDENQYSTQSNTELSTLKTTDVNFIDFGIKNNSIRINSYYVKGPNGRGGDFSYGFKMLPFTSRAEYWPVGTIVYEQSHGGKLKELIVIIEGHEGNVIDLYY